MIRAVKHAFKFAALILLLALAGCAGAVSATPTRASSAIPVTAPSATTASSPVPPTPTATMLPIATTYPPPLQSTPTTTASLTPSSNNFDHPQVATVASGLPNPDDLLALPDGSVYVSDVNDGTIRKISASGRSSIFLFGLSVPEGMALLPDGSLVIVEQGKNRLVRWDPQNGQVRPFLGLENATGKLGVDGIALDARPGSPATLVIPDSPNNRLLRADLDGQNLRVIARGLNRPTGAWVEPDGSILVVEEDGGKLDRIHADGRVDTLATGLDTPDDVVEDPSGNIFIVNIGAGNVSWLATGTQTLKTIYAGLSGPQGLALDAQGNLLVTDPGNHRVIRLSLHP